MKSLRKLKLSIQKQNQLNINIHDKFIMNSSSNNHFIISIHINLLNLY